MRAVPASRSWSTWERWTTRWTIWCSENLGQFPRTVLPTDRST
jgi:hypothetical protein